MTGRDEEWEVLDASEEQRAIESLIRQWFEDIGLDVDAHWSFHDDGVLTDSVKVLGAETEYLRPATFVSSVDDWQAWIEDEYAPSWY